MALAALSKAVDEMTAERDAALVAKEDLVAQLRVTKKRLQEAEDEQYKAEEEAASLRAEVQSMQQSEPGDGYKQSSYFPESPEIASMKSELERLRQEKEKLATEQQRNALLTSKLKDLEIAKTEAESTLNALQKKQSERGDANSASVTVPLTEFSALDDTGSSRPKHSKHEAQLHELASMVERLEKGRQKLLGEIDAQSSEIERLFVENANLTSSVEEMTEAASQWEKQVQQCLEHNAQLRSELSRLRMEQAMISASEQVMSSDRLLENGSRAQPDSSANSASLDDLKRENSKIKVELAKVQAREVEQTAQIAQLSADLNRAVLTSNTLGRMYGPVLSSFENRLLQLKQNFAIPDSGIY